LNMELSTMVMMLTRLRKSIIGLSVGKSVTITNLANIGLGIRDGKYVT